MTQLPQKVQDVLHELPGVGFTTQGPRRIRAELPANTLPTLLNLLKGRAGYLHLSAISCVDWPGDKEFELVYHLWSYETKVLISAHIRVAKEPGRYISMYDIHRPAAYFERDIHEMFGLYFEGAPDMRPFVLTDWHGPPPMLKSFSSMQYVQDTYDWQDYHPQWRDDVEARGGSVDPAPNEYPDAE